MHEMEVSQSRAERGQATTGRRHAVLVVDDHEDTRAMSLIVLRSQGFDASAAAGADDAFARACEQRPDVIVTDLAMPDGDGWDLIQKLSSDPRTNQIPVVMLTACATEQVRERAARERLAGFFFKPCPPDALAAELRRLCGRTSAPLLSPRS
jgi:CheY-like chemotaxis protein